MTAVQSSPNAMLRSASPRGPSPLYAEDRTTVIPGLNDSHMHIVREGLTYNMGLRWDGVPSLADALRMLRHQAERTRAPQWVRVVGGWSGLALSASSGIVPGTVAT